jgi:hypothetical protein
MATRSPRLYDAVRLGSAIQAAISTFGRSPSDENRRRLERAIKKLAYRRKYDGEFLTTRRKSRNKWSPERVP